MCGIFGYVGSRTDAPRQTLEGLKKLEYRGYDSWGVACVQQKQIRVTKKIGKIGQATLPNIQSCLAIGHTRWATHGGITRLNAHPHLNPDQTIAVVHNGIIENHSELKLLLKQYLFKSETDTEVITALVDKKIKNASLADTVFSVVGQLKGLNAFVVAHAPTQQIVATRSGSPLVVGKNNDGYYLASDTTALAGIVNDVLFLEDRQVVLLSQHSIELFASNGEAVSLNWQPLTLSAQSIDKQGYDHFMLKEVNEQPLVLQTVLAEIASLKVLHQKIANKKIVLVGCGTAYHACLSATYYFATLTGQWAQAFSGSEFKPWRSLVDQNTHVIFVSQSGETIDIIEHAQWLLHNSHSFSAIVNRTDSTLSRLAAQTFYLNAGPEICVLATKSFTAQLATLLLLAAKKSNFISVKKEILASNHAVSDVLTNEFSKKYILPLVNRITLQKNIFVIGKNEGYPIALEAALKIKESTYLHMEGFAAGELKHGVLALIEKETPVFAILPDTDAVDELLASAQEVKARGAYLIGLGDSKQQQDIFDWYIPIQTTGLATGITQSVVFQLIAYYVSLALNRDPDKPRNLAKSVTVR